MSRAYNVIDADGHILEPLDLWDKYMDPKFRDGAPHLVKGEDGKDRLVIEERTVGDSRRGFGGIGGIGARQGVVASDTMKYQEGRPGGFDPHQRIPDMDADGIDAAFLYPSIGLFAGSIQDPELAAATCRAYNRWLADYCKPYPDRLFGVAMLPMQSVELAIEEMRYAREALGMRGGFRSIGAVCPREEARGGGSRTPRFRDPRRSRHNLAPTVEATLPNRVATSGRPTAGDGLLGRDSGKPRPSPRNSAAG